MAIPIPRAPIPTATACWSASTASSAAGRSAYWPALAAPTHNWGGFGLRGGVAWSRNEVKSNRDVAFAGFSDSLSARYNAHTRQAFIEAGYRFGSAEGGLEPYLQVARVEVDLTQIDERGGAAALHGKVDDTGTTVATAGATAAPRVPAARWPTSPSPTAPPRLRSRVHRLPTMPSWPSWACRPG
ncbi:hypothetical protein G6F32_014213 [Rhizopus arrhizus]|nr:hypothetical protein G6F32_014213 [Rhizopus arrhizus]